MIAEEMIVESKREKVVLLECDGRVGVKYLPVVLPFTCVTCPSLPISN